MLSPFRKKENGIQNPPIVNCHADISAGGFGDHLRGEKGKKTTSRYSENCHFYLLIVLVGFVIALSLPVIFAQSANGDDGGSGDGDDDGGSGDGDDDGGSGDGDDDGGRGDGDDDGGSDTTVDGDDIQNDAITETDKVQESDNHMIQGVTSFDTTVEAKPGDPNNPGQIIDPNNPGQIIDPNNPGQIIDPNNPGQIIDPNNPGQIIDPNNPGQIIDPNNPGQIIDPNNPGQIIDPNNPGQIGDIKTSELHEDSESVSEMKEEVKKTEEIFSLEDKNFVDGIINYAKEIVDKDIDEESKQLLTTLTPDETKALVSAQIQFIGFNLENIPASTIVPSGTVGDTEPSQPTDAALPIPGQPYCEKHPKDSECESKNDNKTGNGKDSDDNNSHSGGGSNADKIVIQSANPIASANTVDGTYVCSLEGIAAATHQAFDLLKYQTCGSQLNGQKAYYDGFVQQCMQGNSKEICEAATGVSSIMEKQLLQPLRTPQTMQQQAPQTMQQQAPQTMQQQAPQTMQQQAPQTMQQQAPQTMQQYVQQESQHQVTTQKIMEILNNVPETQRQGILSKVDQSQLPKLIQASFPLAMTVVDVAPGSKVVKEITERPELHAVLNAHEKQVFLSLNTYPTPEKLAEFLDLPPEKLPEFLNMLTKDELIEMFDMLPQDTLTSVLSSLSINERNRIETDLGGTAISSV